MSGQQRLSDLMPRPLTTRSKPWLALATYGSIGVGFATLVTRTCLKHPLFPFQASLSLAPSLALSLAPALTLTLRRKAPVMRSRTPTPTPDQADSAAWSFSWLVTTVFDYYGAAFCLCGVILSTEPRAQGALWSLGCLGLGAP